MSNLGVEFSPTTELFAKAQAALEEEKLKFVSLGGCTVTWLDEGLPDAEPPIPDELVVFHIPIRYSKKSLAGIRFAPDGSINSVFGMGARRWKGYEGSGSETHTFAEELAGKILPDLIDDRFLDDSRLLKDS